MIAAGSNVSTQQQQQVSVFLQVLQTERLSANVLISRLNILLAGNANVPNVPRTGVSMLPGPVPASVSVPD
jgi:hypothetical protein